MFDRASILVCACVVLASCHFQLGIGFAEAHTMKPGLYEIAVSVELPHLTAPASVQKVALCITQTHIDKHDTFKILSASPLSRCPTLPICFGEGKAGFQVNCPGKRAAHAIGTFEMGSHTFRGSIRMNMGGKNMTVIERQTGKRVGSCE